MENETQEKKRPSFMISKKALELSGKSKRISRCIMNGLIADVIDGNFSRRYWIEDDNQDSKVEKE